MSGRQTYARTVNEFILTPYREYMFFKACFRESKQVKVMITR